MEAFEGKKIPRLIIKINQTITEIRANYCRRSIHGDCSEIRCEDCLYGNINVDLFSKWYNQKK